MQARVEDLGDVTIIHLSGRIDYEAADRFRSTCLKIFKNRKLIFNLEKLNFVGSSGITPFLETMSDLSQSNQGQLKLCRVSSEFRKIFESGPLKEIEIFENSEAAKNSFGELRVDFSMAEKGFVGNPQEGN